MIMTTKENIHSGHRKRLRENIQTKGIYDLNYINYLEYLLTFVIPRSDTNPLAHALLDKFLTVDNVFNATYNELLSIPGIGPRAAEFLVAVGSSSYFRNKSKLDPKIKLNSLKAVVNFITSIMPPSKNEQFIAISLGKNYIVKSYKIFKGASHSRIVLDTNQLTDFLLTNKSGFYLFAHTHPEHNSTPSESDNNLFLNFLNLANSLAFVIIDNLILGEEDFYSFHYLLKSPYQDLDIDYQNNHLIDLKAQRLAEERKEMEQKLIQMELESDMFEDNINF